MTRTVSPPKPSSQKKTDSFPGIESDDETCGGAPRIAGTRVTVGTIMARYRVHSGSIEAILIDYPLLTEKQVRTAMDYYAKHQEEIDAEQREIARIRTELSERWRNKLRP
jgi:uncharacterized protein (DUF433 family)